MLWRMEASTVFFLLAHTTNFAFASLQVSGPCGNGNFFAIDPDRLVAVEDVITTINSNSSYAFINGSTHGGKNAKYVGYPATISTSDEQDCVTALAVNALGSLEGAEVYVSGRTDTGPVSNGVSGTFMCGTRCHENDSPLPGLASGLWLPDLTFFAEDVLMRASENTLYLAPVVTNENPFFIEFESVCSDFVPWAQATFGDINATGSCTVTRGDADVSFSFAGDTCELSSCGPGFALTEDTLICQPGETPEFAGDGGCDAVPCEDFNSFADTTNSNGATCANNAHGESCSLTCANGFQLSNNQTSATYICDPNVESTPSWRYSNASEVVIAACSPKTCENFTTFVAEENESLPSDTYSPPECDLDEHNARCLLTCATGFELSDEKSSGGFICNPNEDPYPGWRHEDNSDIAAVCNQRHCTDFETWLDSEGVDNYESDCSTDDAPFVHNTECKATCVAGYQFSEGVFNKNFTCQSSLAPVWSADDVGTCSPIPCETFDEFLSEVNNAIRAPNNCSGSETENEIRCDVVCDIESGYEYDSGATAYVCNSLAEDGPTWEPQDTSDNTVCTPVTCSNFTTWIQDGSDGPNVANASSSCSLVNFNDRCSVTCDKGFLLKGQNTTNYICGVGDWTAENAPAECELDGCATTVMKDGRCVKNDDSSIMATHSGVGSGEQCCAICGQTDDCVAFSYHPTEERCNILSNGQFEENGETCETGEFGEAAECTNRTVHKDMSCPGPDTADSLVDSDLLSFTECCNRCEVSAQCKTFSVDMVSGNCSIYNTVLLVTSDPGDCHVVVESEEDAQPGNNDDGGSDLALILQIAVPVIVLVVIPLTIWLINKATNGALFSSVTKKFSTPKEENKTTIKAQDGTILALTSSEATMELMSPNKRTPFGNTEANY